MSNMEILEKMKTIQSELDEYLDNDDNIEEKYQNLIYILKNQDILRKRYIFRLLLHIISNISNYHYRGNDFFSKIERILQFCKESIITNLSNHDIFHIFRMNKRILLFLIKEHILQIDNFLITKLFSKKYRRMKYPQYFLPEIKSYLKDKYVNSKIKGKLDILLLFKKLPENFESKRQKGENDEYICDLIRNDSIEDFIIYINKTSPSLNTNIEFSIYETNPFLLNKKKIFKNTYGKNYEIKKTTLIEYAAFFGSIQIFRYLYKNGVELTSSLWIYSIHGNNPEIIHFLEENKIEPDNSMYSKCLIESIKCHHNDISNYIENNYSNQKDLKDEIIITKSLKYYNFNFIDYINESMFFYLCRYDYPIFVESLMRNCKINLNQIFIYKYDGSEIPSEDNKGFILRRGNTGLESVDEGIYIKKKNALIAAVEKENIEIVKLLLKSEEIDVNIPRLIHNEEYINGCGVEETALQIAVKNQNEEIVKLLLSVDNINPNLLKLINNEGSRWGGTITTLNTAIKKENIEIVKLLLSSNKVDVNEYSMERAEKRWTRAVTALHMAIEKSFNEIVKVLLESEKIDPNIYTIEGHYDNMCEILQNTWLVNIVELETPLHIAVRKKNIEIIQYLLSNKKTDINLKNWLDLTPIDYASENEQILNLFNKVNE